MKALDVLSLPLQGRQVIEASAGTGKTWTLSALYVRLVIGHARPQATPLKPSQILVMTFTDAATAELRERIRKRLQETAVFFDELLAQRHPQGDAFLNGLASQLEPDAQQQAAAWLHAAAQNMDDAAIFTIHAWSRRMLGRFALQSRDVFEQTHLDNPNALLHDLINDYWRRCYYPLPLAAQSVLHSLWQGDPQKLLAAVQTLWKSQDLAPQSESLPPPDDAPTVLAPYLQWQTQCHTLQAQVRQNWQPHLAETLLAAQANGLIRGRGITKLNFVKWVGALQAWAEHAQDIKPDILQRFALSALMDKGWAQAQDYPVFADIESLMQQRAQEPPCKDPLVAHAADALRQAYREAKLQRSAFDFQDLLQRLHSALRADGGEMAAAIREQYPVAMVDEFQDTDPWQYESLKRIYDRDVVDPQRNAWVMIGDPKQAIYSFRGADLNTYIQARTEALQMDDQAVHSLHSNFRSTPRLVNALNHMFGQVPQLFTSGEDCIGYVPVNSQSDEEPLTDAQGHAPQPVQVMYLPVPDGSEQAYLSSPVHLQLMAEGFAATMVDVLQRYPDVTPGDMAVLVRSHTHAKAMQTALRKRQLPSVFLSDHANVYQSEEALDLWRVLRAIASPRQSHWMRSALASRLWGLSLAQLPLYVHNEAHADALSESCQRWLQQWEQQGVLPMLYSWIHEQHIAARLLALPQGERRLTNLLHLGELLQDASQHLQGPQALLQHLSDNLQDSLDHPEAQKMRLETDSQCVQIVTFHKSKGLEYPLVFVPFLGSFSAKEKGDKTTRDDDEESVDISASTTAEDARLLYVALTRAKRGLWLGIAPTRDAVTGGKDKALKFSAVSRLLQRQSRDDLLSRLQTAWGDCADIAIQALPTPHHRCFPGLGTQAHTQTARTPQRAPHALWWTASFSSLTRSLEAGTPREEAYTDGLNDAALDPLPTTASSAVKPHLAWQSFPAGARYGTFLHNVLQYQAEHAWPLAQSHNKAQDMAWQQLLQRKADWLALPSEALALLPAWLQTILATPLPLLAADAPSQQLGPPLVLQALHSDTLWAEMEFNLPVGQLSSQVLDAHIQRHVLPHLERPALQNKVLQGMLSGFMDLVLQHDGRYWVLDYKSNLLNGYQADDINTAILNKRYEVQYVLYTLALHRLLKSRLPDYHYEQHMGGAVYLFLRGIDTPGAGVHALRPPWALIDLLDQSFAKEAL